MQAPFKATSGIAYPGDMKLLKEVFDRFCADHRIPPDSGDAEKIAQAAMSLFRAGVFDEAELLASLEEFQKRRGPAVQPAKMPG